MEMPRKQSAVTMQTQAINVSNVFVKHEATGTHISSLFFTSLTGHTVSSSVHARSALTCSAALGALPTTRVSFSLRQDLVNTVSRHSRLEYSS